MNSPLQHQQLKQQLDRQLQVCIDAKELANSLANNLEFDVTFQVELSRLDELTKQIALEQVQLSSVLSQAGIERLPTPELRGLASQLGKQIADLITLFDLIEKRVTSAKNRLNPNNGSAVQTKRMHAAYSS